MKLSFGLRLGLLGFLFLSGADHALAGPKEQCIDKIVNGLQGRGPSTQELQSNGREVLVDSLLVDPRFVEKFSRHVNDYFNDSVVGASDEANAPYFFAKKILSDRLPWSEMFNGTWSLRTEGAAPNTRVLVVQDPAAFGYFTNLQWNIRYEGGEGEGFQLRKAYRIPHNMVGLRLPAVDAQGMNRKDPAGACYGCHFEPKNIFALDLIAQALPKKLFLNGQPQSGQFVDPVYAKPEDAPDVLLMKDLSGLKAVVQTLLGENFRNDYNFNVCRMVFQYFYQRNEADNSLDFKQFDACMNAFENASGPVQNIRAAIKGMVMTPEFCSWP
jgi:hypothetical protein